MDLERLAERVEAAGGPDADIDHAIWDAVRGADNDGAPNFTASLDAAMTLVPEGYEWGCGTDAGDPENGPWAWCDERGELPDDYLRFAATPALALTAAALRARSLPGVGE